MREILYHPAALAELHRQVDRLLATPFTIHVVENFIREMRKTEQAIVAHPERYSLIAGTDFRRFGPTRIYRFSVVYRIVDGDIHILAVAHPSRRPRYWAKRRIS